MERDPAVRPPAPPSISQQSSAAGWLHRPPNSTGKLGGAGKGHRRSRSAPLSPGATFEPDERTGLPSLFQGHASISGQGAGSRRRSSGGFLCPQTHHTPSARHRRAASLTSDFHSSLARDERGSGGGGGSRNGTGRSAHMRELPTEASHRPPLRHRADHQSSRAQVTSGLLETENGGHDGRNSDGSAGSGRRVRRNLQESALHGGHERGSICYGLVKEGGKPGGGTTCESSERRHGLAQGGDAGERRQNTNSYIPDVDVQADVAPMGTCAGSQDQEEQSPLPGLTDLTTRRSSDSTVGIWDSPRHAPEGLKTDEEDYLGRKPIFNLVGSTTRPEVLPTVSADVSEKSMVCDETGSVTILVDYPATGRLPTKMRDKDMLSKEESTTLALDARESCASRGGGGIGSEGVSCSGKDGNETVSRCESGSADDRTTRMGSFDVPPASTNFAGVETVQLAAVGEPWSRRRSGSGNHSNVGGAPSGGGNPATPATFGSGSVVESDPALTDVKSAVIGSRSAHIESRKEAYEIRRVVGASGDGTGAEGGGVDASGAGERQRSRERSEGGGRDRLGSMLDAYREPEPCAHENDWGELEDWQGLPGLGFGAGGNGAEQSRLQVPPLIFRSGAVNEGDVLSLLGRPRSRKPGTGRPLAQRGSKGIDTTGTPSIESSPRARVSRPVAEREAAGAGTGDAAEGMGRIFSPSRSIKAGGLGRGASDGARNPLNAGGRAADTAGGTGRQPLLLSLADLTTAGLQKLLQAEGDSKMFFDPDAQRWVGEEVDLSGFEDPSPGAGPIGPCSSAGSAAAAATATSATAAAPDLVSPLPFTSLDEFGTALPPVRVRALASDGAARASVPTAAHRRWSSGEEIHTSRHVLNRSHGAERIGVVEWAQHLAAAATVDESLHRRRHSSGKRPEGALGSSSAGRHRRVGSGSSRTATARERGIGGRGDPEEVDRNRVRSRKGGSLSQASSLASCSFRSDSDTGSVVRLWEVGGGAMPAGAVEESQSYRQRLAFDADAWRGDGLLMRRPRTAEPRGSVGYGAGGDGRGSDPSTSTSTPGGRKRLSQEYDRGDQLARPRPVHRPAFDGSAAAAAVAAASAETPARLAGADAWSPSRLQSPSPPSGEALMSRAGSQAEPRWPWVSLSTESSPLIGLESGLASESELGASETSDWDQDNDFEGLPDNPDFKLTLEKPTKFGYSPGYMPGSSGGGGAPSPGSRRASIIPAILGNTDGESQTSEGFPDAPPFAPRLFRYRTAPPTTGGGRAAGGGSDAFLEWPLKGAFEGSGKLGRHQRRGTFTDQRFDSMGSAAEWDQTLEGDLDITKARRPRSPQGTAPAPPPPTAFASEESAAGVSLPSASSPVPPSLSESGTEKSGSNLGDSVLSSSGLHSGAGAAGRSSVSAVSVAWEAFKRHSAGSGGGKSIEDAVTTTIRAAATATTLAVEHLRRSRSRLLLEKGGMGGSRRLSGPLQITLDDLKAPPAAVGVSAGGDVDTPGAVKSPSAGAAAVATGGAHFNPDKMCWEGFEEPDLTGFETSDSESEQDPVSSVDPPTSCTVPAQHQQLHLPDLGLGVGRRGFTFGESSARVSSPDRLPDGDESASYNETVGAAHPKTHLQGEQGVEGGAGPTNGVEDSGSTQGVGDGNVRAVEDALDSCHETADSISPESIRIDQAGVRGALNGESGFRESDAGTGVGSATEIGGAITTAAVSVEVSGEIAAGEAEAGVVKDTDERALRSGSSGSGRDSDDSGFEDPVGDMRDRGGGTRASGVGLVEKITRSLAMFSPARRDHVAASTNIATGENKQHDTVAAAASTGGAGPLAAQKNGNGRRSPAADGAVASHVTNVEDPVNDSIGLPPAHLSTGSVGEACVPIPKVVCGVVAQGDDDEEEARQEMDCIEAENDDSAGERATGSGCAEGSQVRSRTPTERHQRAGCEGSLNTTIGEVSDWDRSLGSPTADIEAAAVSAAASSAAAILPESHGLDPLFEERTTAGCSIGSPQVYQTSGGPVLFTLASLDTAAMSTSGVRGGWGEGPTTIAPTRQQLSAGRELGRFADGGAAAGTISSAVAAFAASTSVFARIGATTDVADGDVTGGGVQTADLRAEIEHREGERAAAARGEDRGRMHNMVSRSIFPGPMGEAIAREGGEGDVRASTSHMTKSTEDDTVDDWGADFVGGLCLTPRTGGGLSMWGHSELGGFEEGDNEEGQCPSPPSTPRNAASALPPNPTTGEIVRDRTFSFNSTVSPRPLYTSSSFEHRYYPRQHSSYNSFPGRSGSVGEGLMGSAHHHSPPPARSTVYGPSVKRIPVEISSDALLIRSNTVGGRIRGSMEGSSRSGDSGDDGDGTDLGGGEAGSERIGGVAADIGRAESGQGPPRRPKPEYRRRRRSRGYQTISKREYTPMYVPTAWLNPKSGRWEPVDGYAVDMSGFGTTDGADSNPFESSSRKVSGLGAESSWRPAGTGSGGNSLVSPPLSRGPSFLGTPPSQEQLRRRGSTSTNSGNGSTAESRAAAFHLSPSTLRHLARSEQAHDQAMNAFLGHQGYSQAKRQGASLLLRLPGIASAARTTPNAATVATSHRQRVTTTPSPNKNPAVRSHSIPQDASEGVVSDKVAGVQSEMGARGGAGLSTSSRSGRRDGGRGAGAGGEAGDPLLASPGGGFTTLEFPGSEEGATLVSTSSSGARGGGGGPTSSGSSTMSPCHIPTDRSRQEHARARKRSSIRTISSSSVSPARSARLPDAAAMRRGSTRGTTITVAGASGATAGPDAAGGSSPGAKSASARSRGRAGRESLRTAPRTRRASRSSLSVVGREVDAGGRGADGAGGGSTGGKLRRRVSDSHPARARRASQTSAASSGSGHVLGGGRARSATRAAGVRAGGRQTGGPDAGATGASHSPPLRAIVIDVSPPRTSPPPPSATRGSASGATPGRLRREYDGAYSRRTSPRALRSSVDPVAMRGSPKPATPNTSISSTRTDHKPETFQPIVGGPLRARSSPSSPPPPVPPRHSPRVVRSPPLARPYASAESGRHGLEEAIWRRGTGYSGSAPLSPRTYQFNRTASQGRVSSCRSRPGGISAQGSSQGERRERDSLVGMVIGRGRSDSIGEGSASPIGAAGAAASGGVAAAGESTAAIAAAERAKIERRMRRFRDTAEFAASLVRERVAAGRRHFMDGSSSCQGGDIPPHRGHRRRRSGGASRGGSGSSAGVSSTAGINFFVWR